jgi:hypothetical protein
VSYGIEIATLVDTCNLVGLGGMAQTDVGCRQNSHQPLGKLAVMAQEIMCTAMRRTGHATPSMARMYLPWKGEFQDIESIERPPIAIYKENSSMLHSRRPEGTLRYPGPPFINIDGVRMFRDIGGYQTSDGVSVRKGLMFRSGDPSSMTPNGLDSFQKLAIGKVFDLRSPIETTTFVHGHAKHADSGFASPDESDSDAVNSMFLSTGVEVIAAPVFPDEEWLPQRRDDRLEQYASAAQVRNSKSTPLSNHV